jgi:zinc and cadmium transporter
MALPTHYFSLLLIVAACTSVVILSIGLSYFFTSRMPQEKLNLLLAFSAGSLLSAAFLNLIPEAFQHTQTSIKTLSALLLIAVLVFFLLEKLAIWRCFHPQQSVAGAKSVLQAAPWVSVAGDALHNFTDGLLIAAAFAIEPWLGVTACAAVLAHEIPQEIGDFALYRTAGWSLKKALTVNGLVSSTLVLGGILGWVITDNVQAIAPYILLVAAANFIYVSLVDLLPYLNQERDHKRVLGQLLVLLCGLAWVPILSELLPH